MQAVIIAGGKGTRLKELNGNLPKPLVDIGGKPLIEHQILLARANGIDEILLLTGFGADAIQDYCQDGRQWDVEIQYHRESQPLGTAGAVLDAFHRLKRDFVVLYADTMLDVDLRRMCSFHGQSPGITLFLHPNDHPQDSDLIEIDETNRVIGLHPYPHPPGQHFRNLVNAGLYVVRKDCLAPWYERRATLAYPFDFGKHLFPETIASGCQMRGYVSREYIKDAGTPQRVYRVREDLLAGRIQAARWHCKKRAVFLGLELLPGAAEAVRTVNESGRLAVVVANQPVGAGGNRSENEGRTIHNKFEWLLGHEGAFVDGVYCRRQPSDDGPLEKAVADLNIDVEQSWMIGAGPADIDAARRFGIHSILIQSGRRDTQLSNPPDFVCEDVLSAVRLIGEKEQRPQ
jgi:NDP-sugar pyrophosphorylase family protein